MRLWRRAPVNSTPCCSVCVRAFCFLLYHANRSLYFGLRPRAPWLRNASASRHSLLMSDTRASTLKSRQYAYPNQKDEQTKCLFALLVEVTGFEPTTSWSRTKRATKLRYASIAVYIIPKAAGFFWSRRRDLNPRPLGPEPSALPNCATPRLRCILYQRRRGFFGRGDGI